MTITSRRRSYWFFFLLSLAVLVTALFLSLPVFDHGFSSRSPAIPAGGGGWSLFGFEVGSTSQAVMGSLVLASFSSLVLLSVLISFRKTGSAEVFFFAFWMLSCSFEAGRVLALRIAAAGYPDSWLAVIARTVLTLRFGGYGALFLAGLHASGFRSEHPGRSLAGAVALGLALATALPVDTGELTATLLPKLGYASAELLVVLALALVTAANFHVGASMTGEPGFRIAALGALAMLAGQYLFIHEWHPLWQLLALALLIGGARFFISRLHAYYLWQ